MTLQNTNKIPVIAIFDVGKTNKKLLLFSQQYEVLDAQTEKFPETKDENDFPCDDLEKIRSWISKSLESIWKNEKFDVKAINFATYGASFVYINKEGVPLTALYNYLKPFPKELQSKFNNTYGEERLALETRSPLLGSLNSGMQLYRLKYEQPEVFGNTQHALHLPQYLSFTISGEAYSEPTSIGCHTQLWNFEKNDYHDWVVKEALHKKLAPAVPSNTVLRLTIKNKNIVTGIGLHDSSAALIPYLMNFHEPFVLISTGTWCISLNPFNDLPLTTEELQHDCLCYLSYEGKPVKASRLFAGYEHEQQVKRIGEHFNEKPERYQTCKYNEETIIKLAKESPAQSKKFGAMLMKESEFAKRELSSFANYEEAYHQLMLDLVALQVASTNLVIRGTIVKKIFVDGGFSKNCIYMHLLARAFAEIEIYAASVPEATALGAALAIHNSWNSQPIPLNFIHLKYHAGDGKKS